MCIYICVYIYIYTHMRLLPAGRPAGLFCQQGSCQRSRSALSASKDYLHGVEARA